jgi:hypothetical protein
LRLPAGNTSVSRRSWRASRNYLEPTPHESRTLDEQFILGGHAVNRLDVSRTLLLPESDRRRSFSAFLRNLRGRSDTRTFFPLPQRQEDGNPTSPKTIDTADWLQQKHWKEISFEIVVRTRTPAVRSPAIRAVILASKHGRPRKISVQLTLEILGRGGQEYQSHLQRNTNPSSLLWENFSECLILTIGR